MTKRRKILIFLLGVLPAVILLEACSPTADDINKDAIEIRASEMSVSTSISTAVETRARTQQTPIEPGQSSTTTPAEQVERSVVDLRGAGLTYQSMILADGSELEFALLLPEGFNPVQTYPVLFALPPGPQSRDMVEAGLSSYWAPGAAGRDWIVVTPIAPGGRLFFRGAEQLLPEFLEAIKEQLPVEGDRFHLAGISNGGISAFRIAIQQPELFHSMVVLPGFPADQDFSKLDRLLEMPVTMYVGELDSEWVQEMSETQRELERLQVNSTLEIVPGNRHFISGVSGEQIFDILDSYR
jgi:pimeloyl-ACP methyl ester carboxylesterase